MSECKKCTIYKQANVNILLKNNELFLRVNELVEEKEALKAELKEAKKFSYEWALGHNDRMGLDDCMDSYYYPSFLEFFNKMEEWKELTK